MSADYVAVAQPDGSAIFHRPSCSYLSRVEAPTRISASDFEAHDRCCKQCLPEGLQAAESQRLMLPWGNDVGVLHHRMRIHCGQLSDNELNSLHAAVAWPTETNCWWAIYEAAAMMRTIVERELRMRRDQ